ncbi:transcription elongation factor A N-terminal and central domain-containing protein [Aplochiton taeniatus]
MDSSALRSKCVQLLQAAITVLEGSSVTSQQQGASLAVPEGSSVTSVQQGASLAVPEGSSVTSQQQTSSLAVPEGSSVTSQQQTSSLAVSEGSSVTSQQRLLQAASLAGDIEQHIHQLHPHNQAKYKACVRTKVANLRNPRSGHLRLALLGGWLGPGAFARMSVEEMAGEELQRLREQYSLRGIRERQLPVGVEGTPTERLRCRRCGHNLCSVTQVSRGTLFLPAWARGNDPDDDAMTFVTCGRCGEQWYHSGWTCL